MEIDTRKEDFIRCTGNESSECGTCDSCILNKRLNFTKEWFTRLSEKARQVFIRKLFNSCCSLELITSLLGLLKPLQYKDFTYAKCKASPTFNSDLSSTICVSNSVVNQIDMARYISEDERWFETASSWTKLNYLLRIFQFCNPYTLDAVKSLLQKRYEAARKANAKSMSASTRRYSAKTTESFHGVTGEQSLIIQSEIQDSKETTQSIINSRRCDKLTRSSVSFSPTLQERIGSRADPRYLDETFELESTTLSRPSSHGSRRNQSGRLSARCYPYSSRRTESRYRNSSDDDSDSDNYLSLDDLTESWSHSQFRNLYRALPKQRDFIRRLPVHLSKYILGFLDPSSLVNCVCVSDHWRFLAEEVRNETFTQQIMREDVMLIQGSTENIPNPLYARIVPLHVPKLSETGEIVFNNQARHIDVTSEYEEFETRDMQNCFEGIETVVVDVEERNIYCGAYNVLVLNQSKDNCRVTYYDGGKFVPVASMDRRIRLLDVKSGRCEKTIVEHVGSVKSVCTDESRGFVVSGSYDTTIRLWDIKTGRCQRIFLGHKSSVISLSLHGRYLASGSTDKTCRVWNIKTGKCTRTFRHRNVIQSVSIGDQLLLTGCSAGKVRVWDFKAAKLIKSLDGHMGPITCARFNECHIVTASKDCYAMAWSTKGDFKRCLQTFRHPKEVNCLEIMYCRVITGSADGKIRLWNILNGECLRIIRGNSRNDPITALYASDERLIINTRSNLLLYNFEPVDWDYNSPAEKVSDFVKQSASISGGQCPSSHAFNRAQALRRKGSGWMHGNSMSNMMPNNTENALATADIKRFQRSMRVQSAPVRPPSDSIQKHISRVQSAVMQKRNLLARPENKERTRIARGILKNHTPKAAFHEDENEDLLAAAKNNLVTREVSAIRTLESVKGTAPNSNVPRVIARSRSAPAHRTRTLPPNERGFTSSSSIQVKILENKFCPLANKEQHRKIRPFSATTSMLKNPTDVYCNLKLKSFYQQLDYEAELIQKRI